MNYKKTGKQIRKCLNRKDNYRNVKNIQWKFMEKYICIIYVSLHWEKKTGHDDSF